MDTVPADVLAVHVLTLLHVKDVLKLALTTKDGEHPLVSAALQVLLFVCVLPFKTSYNNHQYHPHINRCFHHYGIVPSAKGSPSHHAPASPQPLHGHSPVTVPNYATYA